MAEKKKAEKKKVESKTGEAADYAEAFAEMRDISETEAMACLAVIGWGRVKALKKDNARRDKGLKAQHRRVQVTVLDPKKKPAPKAKKVKKVKKAKKAKPAVAKSASNGAAHTSA